MKKPFDQIILRFGFSVEKSRVTFNCIARIFFFCFHKRIITGDIIFGGGFFLKRIISCCGIFWMVFVPTGDFLLLLGF